MISHANVRRDGLDFYPSEGRMPKAGRSIIIIATSGFFVFHIFWLALKNCLIRDENNDQVIMWLINVGFPSPRYDTGHLSLNAFSLGSSVSILLSALMVVIY